jgi:hypothetical protein
MFGHILDYISFHCLRHTVTSTLADTRTVTARPHTFRQRFSTPPTAVTQTAHAHSRADVTDRTHLTSTTHRTPTAYTPHAKRAGRHRLLDGTGLLTRHSLLAYAVSTLLTERPRTGVPVLLTLPTFNTTRATLAACRATTNCSASCTSPHTYGPAST